MQQSFVTLCPQGINLCRLGERSNVRIGAICCMVWALTWGLAAPAACAADGPPNVVLILADDLGYGDVSCFNNASKVRSERIDALARQGMRFTGAHSAS